MVWHPAPSEAILVTKPLRHLRAARILTVYSKTTAGRRGVGNQRWGTPREGAEPMLRKLGLVGILIVVLIGAVAPAAAQVQTGSLFIKIVDDQGGAVPGATVTLTS